MPAVRTALLAALAAATTTLAVAEPPREDGGDRPGNRQIPAILQEQAGAAGDRAVDPECDDEAEQRRLAEESSTRKRVTTTRARPLTPEMIERVLEVAQKVDPRLATRLRRLKERDEEAFSRAMSTSGRPFLALAELKTRDPSLYSLKLGELKAEVRIRNLATRLREAESTGSADVDRLRKQLRNEVTILVAHSIALRGMYLKRLEEEIDRDAANFDQIVEERYRRLVGSALEPHLASSEPDAEARSSPEGK